MARRPLLRCLCSRCPRLDRAPGVAHQSSQCFSARSGTVVRLVRELHARQGSCWCSLRWGGPHQCVPHFLLPEVLINSVFRVVIPSVSSCEILKNQVTLLKGTVRLLHNLTEPLVKTGSAELIRFVQEPLRVPTTAHLNRAYLWVIQELVAVQPPPSGGHADVRNCNNFSQQLLTGHRFTSSTSQERDSGFSCPIVLRSGATLRERPNSQSGCVKHGVHLPVHTKRLLSWGSVRFEHYPLQNVIAVHVTRVNSADDVHRPGFRMLLLRTTNAAPFAVLQRRFRRVINQHHRAGLRRSVTQLPQHLERLNHVLPFIPVKVRERARVSVNNDQSGFAALDFSQ